jgi:hypothetical protein
MTAVGETSKNTFDKGLPFTAAVTKNKQASY